MPYDFNEFLKACGIPGNVTIAYDAKNGAGYFNLLTESAILAFIACGGLENPNYINTDVWHLNPNKPPDVNVDAYSFFSGKKFGYIAFMFLPRTNKWRIKSFKRNNNPNPREIKNAQTQLSLGKFMTIGSK